jgi:hypothetical protein
MPLLHYSILVGFGHACAARTRHFDLIATINGALRAPPPIAASLLLFIQQSFPSGPNSAARGVYLSFGLNCTLLSYIASY